MDKSKKTQTSDKSKKTQTSAVRDILIDTVEIQLAGLKAGVAFWGEWVKNASKFTEIASKGLADIKSNPDKSNSVLSEVAEASKEHLRTTIELPRSAVSKFYEDLDKIRKPRKSPGRTSKKKSKSKRSVRAKE